MADDEDKLVTKPFKFVTGKSSLPRSLIAVETDVHDSRSAPSTFLSCETLGPEVSCVHGLECH